jgi:predicted nucleic acid-binding protein
MPFVVHASVALAWCFNDESSAAADQAAVVLRGSGAVAPPVWPLEVGNALLAAERRRRLTNAGVATAGHLIAELQIEVEEADVDRALGPVVDLARSHGLSTYDASYLETAIRRGLPLATLDSRLAAAARTSGVPLIGQ